MKSILSGVEEIRIHKDEQKWISSDSKMSIPGKKGNLVEAKEIVEIQSFLLAKYPVTKTLFEKVNGHMLGDIAKDSTPEPCCRVKALLVLHINT